MASLSKLNNWVADENSVSRKSHGQEVLAKAKEIHKGEIPVKVDDRTTIFIKPGKDPVAEVEAYKKRVQKCRANHD